MAINPLNFFQNQQMTNFQGISQVQKPVQQPVPPVQEVKAGSNPFAPKNNEEKGVGLVQSDLQNMSYTLPNGKTTNCNTKWIA
ncbi:hypothetical protein SDC9_207530 [bioreactor metagenome]|uniref:Uncharacterized protein n=1 Tax=bioreactor metagenome TaxID=1076179 RepID=A0A645J812_9ZZZZ